MSSGLMPIDAENYRIQLRLRQKRCTASKNGAFSLALSIDEENKVFDRFVYSDIGGLLRDRLEIAYSDEGDNSVYWHKTAVSEETGQLRRGSRSTDYFDVIAQKLGDTIFIGQGENTISSKCETLAMRLNNGKNNLKLSSHSADIYIDKLKVDSLTAVSSIMIKTDLKPTVGQVCDFQVFGKNKSGKFEIPAGAYELTYDSDDIAINDGRVLFKRSGDVSVKATVIGIDGHCFEATRVIHVGKQIGGIHLKAPENVLLKKTYSFCVENDMGKEIACDSIISDGICFGENEFSANTPGEHTVTLRMGTETVNTSIYVSEYEELELVPEKSKANLGEQIGFSLFGLKDGERTEIIADQLQCDKDITEITGQTIALKKYGVAKITAVYHGIEVSAELKAVQPQSGEIFFENFEAEKSYYGFLYDASEIAKKGGSRALQLYNDSVIIDTENASDYEISGRFFVASTDSSAFLPYFGIEVHKENNPVLCSVGEYMRMGCVSADEQFQLQNGAWHTFSVKTIGGNIAYTIDQITHTRAGNKYGSGDITFYAEGMKIFLDDIRYSKQSGSGALVNAQEESFTRSGNAEFLISTVKKRRGDFAMYLLQRAKDNPGIDDINQLANVYALMMLQYGNRDYTNLLRWHIRHTEYSEKILGSANGSGDFSLLQAIRSYYQLRGNITVDEIVFEEIKRYLENFSYPSQETALSENHRLVYLVCEQLGAEITGLKSDSEEALLEFFNDKLENGFMEIQSPHYMVVDLYALETLWQFTQNLRLRNAAYNMAALIYGMQLADSTDGSIAGACSREYASYGNTMTYLPNTLMFGEGVAIDENYPVRNLQLSGLVFSDYLPPDILFEIAAGREYPYEYQTRSRVYSFPFDYSVSESSVRYSYISDKYALGSLVHTDSLEKYKNSDGGYSGLVVGIQEIPWSLSVKGERECLILDSHPGTTATHAEFSGDFNCLCGKYAQDKNISIGMHKIENSSELQYTHMQISKNKFDKFIEERGWIFLEKSGVYIAIKPLKDGNVSDAVEYSWRSSTEIIQNSKDTAFVCEVADAEYKSLDEFKNDILQKTNLQYVISDGQYMLSYRSTDGREIKLDYVLGVSYVDGIAKDYSNVNVITSPYVTCSEGEGAFIYADKSYKVRLK